MRDRAQHPIPLRFLTGCLTGQVASLRCEKPPRPHEPDYSDRRDRDVPASEARGLIKRTAPRYPRVSRKFNVGTERGDDADTSASGTKRLTALPAEGAVHQRAVRSLRREDQARLAVRRRPAR